MALPPDPAIKLSQTLARNCKKANPSDPMLWISENYVKLGGNELIARMAIKILLTP